MTVAVPEVASKRAKERFKQTALGSLLAIWKHANKWAAYFPTLRYKSGYRQARRYVLRHRLAHIIAAKRSVLQILVLFLC